MAPPVTSSKSARKGIKNGFKNLVQKSKSVADLSKLGKAELKFRYDLLLSLSLFLSDAIFKEDFRFETSETLRD
jgi:hypothetical protein